MFPLKISFYRSLVTAFLLILLVTGCSMLPKLWGPNDEKRPLPQKPKLEAAFTASSQLNPNPSGHASPVRVRLYELKSFRTFEQADFVSLDDKDQAILGADLLKRDKLQFQPNEARHYSRELLPETGYIGIVAAYRDIDNAAWRAIIEVKPHGTTHIVVRLDAKAVSMQLVEKDGLSQNRPMPSQPDLKTDVEEAYKTYEKYQGLPE